MRPEILICTMNKISVFTKRSSWLITQLCLINTFRHPVGYNTPFTGCIQSIKIDEHELQFREPDPKLLASTDIGACAGMEFVNILNLMHLS